MTAEFIKSNLIKWPVQAFDNAKRERGVAAGW